MKRKTIKTVLNKKIKEWADSVDDKTVKNLILNDTIITGGAIASMLLNEPVNDFDVYFRTREATLAVAHYYANQFNNTTTKSSHVNVWAKETLTEDKEELVAQGDRISFFIESSGIATDLEHKELPEEPSEEITADVIDDSPKYNPIFFSANAVTLSNKLQIIVRFFGDPEEIHKNFDFVHCTNYYLIGSKNLVLKPEAMEALLCKELVYQGSKYPICSMIRTRKFLKRGFQINAGQYLKMALQISVLDLTDIEVLNDQLTGVDSAYFGIIIDAVEKYKENNPDNNIDISYISSVVDKVFS